MLVRLSQAGVPGLMAEDCVAGACARQSFEECRAPLPAGIGFTAIYSRRDGIVDWRACVDPVAHAGRGHRLAPRAWRSTRASSTWSSDSLLRTASASAVEVDRGESA